MINGASMSRPASRVPTIVCLLFLIAAPRPASAQQESSTEIYGGYSYLLDPGNGVLAITAGDNAFPLGWAAGIAHSITRWMDAVGEVSGNYKTKTTFDAEVSLRFHAAMAGPRAAVRIGRLREFVQVLGGVAYGHASAFGLTTSTSGLCVQPGGGVDYQLSSRIAARLQLDYRWIRKSAEGRAHVNQFHAVAALVYR